jgi:hypothetical protein
MCYELRTAEKIRSMKQGDQFEDEGDKGEQSPTKEITYTKETEPIIGGGGDSDRIGPD